MDLTGKRGRAFFFFVVFFFCFVFFVLRGGGSHEFPLFFFCRFHVPVYVWKGMWRGDRG